MKFTTAYYLLLLYCTVMIKPLVPFIMDAWDHQFNEIEHIAIYHTIHGNNHLDKELGEANSRDDKSKNSTTLRSEDQIPFHVLIPACNFFAVINITAIKQYSVLPDKLPTGCIFKQAPPPKFSC